MITHGTWRVLPLEDPHEPDSDSVTTMKSMKDMKTEKRSAGQGIVESWGDGTGDSRIVALAHDLA